jgi:hypothetical protein
MLSYNQFIPLIPPLDCFFKTGSKCRILTEYLLLHICTYKDRISLLIMSKTKWTCSGCEEGMSMCYGNCGFDVLTGYEIANDYDNGFYWTPASEGSMSASAEKYTYIGKVQCGQKECSSFCTAGICLACNKSHCKLHLKWFGRKHTRLCNNCSSDRVQVERILLGIKDPSVTKPEAKPSDNGGATDEKFHSR